jgi:hypothetical protein
VLVGAGQTSFEFVASATAASSGPRIRIEDTSTTINDGFALNSFSVREINPLSVSIQMQGRMTYADEALAEQALFSRWRLDGSNYITNRLDTNAGGAGGFTALQSVNGTLDFVRGTSNYSPGVNVPFNIASRHGSTFINGAVDGVALTADPTPTALPDLSATDLDLAYDYMGTIKLFRVWADDLADVGIEEATTPSLEPSLSLSFDGTEGSFTVLDWSE